MTTLSCHSCNGTIARDLEVLASSPVEITLRFSVKCPHCKTPNRVEVSTKMEREIRINGIMLKAGTGEGIRDSIRSL